jgi:hypothetical protein
LTSEQEFIAYLQAEVALAYATVNDEILRWHFPIYFGPLTREDDAACMVRMLMNATGAYGDVYSEDEDSESDSEEDEYW